MRCTCPWARAAGTYHPGGIYQLRSKLRVQDFVAFAGQKKPGWEVLRPTGRERGASENWKLSQGIELRTHHDVMLSSTSFLVPLNVHMISPVKIFEVISCSSSDSASDSVSDSTSTLVPTPAPPLSSTFPSWAQERLRR